MLSAHKLIRRLQGCPWTGTRNNFQPEFAFVLEPERFGINFSFTGTGISKCQNNFVHERFLQLIGQFSSSLYTGNLSAANAITKCRK